AVTSQASSFRFPDREHQATALRFSPDGRWLLAGGDDMRVRLWEVATAQRLRDFDGHERTVRNVAFAPDGKTAFSCAGDGLAFTWNLRPGAIHKQSPAKLWDALVADDAGAAYRAIWAMGDDVRPA